MLVDTWSKLKDGFHTGFPKRSAPTQAVGPRQKKRRTPPAPVVKVGSSNIESQCTTDILVNDLGHSSPHLQSPNLKTSVVDSKQKRRKVAAARRMLGAKEKITWWLSNQRTPSQTPTPEDPAIPCQLPPGSPDLFLQTPEQTHQKKQKRRRYRSRKKPALSSDPSSSFLSQQDPISPSMAQLRRRPKTPVPAQAGSKQDEKTTSSSKESSASRQSRSQRCTGNGIVGENHA